MISRYFCFALILTLGAIVRSAHKNKLFLLFASVPVGSSLFFLFTNTSAWIASPDYAKSFYGWFQALTIGIPGYPPTLLFFRNTFLSDLFFTALFVATQALSAKSQARHLLTRSPQEVHQRI
jgi:hypothetical protein